VKEALSKVTPYLESPIKKHRKDSAELKERITAKKKELDIQAAKDRERENFENALKAAKEDMSRGDFDLALSRIRPFKNSDEQEIILDAIEVELKIKKKRKEYLVRRAEETLLKAFMSDLNKGRQLLKDGIFKDVLPIVRKYKNGKLLTEVQKSAFAGLTEEERDNIANMSKEQIEALSNLSKEQKDAISALSADQREAIAGVTQEQIEAIYSLTEEQKAAIFALKKEADHNLEFLKDFETIDKLVEQKKLRLARMRCARWRLDQNMKLRRLANKKYAEIMGAMEPGMAYIEGGTAVVGWDDSADVIIARFDYDSDGKVSKEEFSGPHMLFTEMDENLDGFLAKGEFAIDKLDSDVDGRLNRKEFPAPNYIFSALDTNKDNVIAKDEMVMKEFDNNKDDALTAVEFAGYPDIFDKFDDNDDEIITKEEALVKKLDTDKDGRISREEFVLPTVLFAAMDKDGDGFITPDDDDDNPRRHEAYHNFYIDLHEVSCRDYEKFVLATGYSPPANWPGGKLPRQWHPRPVTGVTQKDASEYAKWAGKRLPTEAEWEVAASWDGEKKTLYPWGNKYIKGSANIRTGSAWKVGTESRDISPNGVYDLAGNVAEWTATPAKTGPAFIVRGSSADKSADPVMARTTRRSLVPSEKATNFIGFRCVKDVK
jgi:formylglycine-generating enzyme required for sulfatase activity